MPAHLTAFRVFIASPGGLSEERKAFRDELQEFNEADGVPRGILFQPIGWEETLGGVGRPQSIVNDEVRSCDFFVLLLCDRWGSSPTATPSRHTSGTHEEYAVAMECHGNKTMGQIVIFFKSVPPAQLADPGDELKRVLGFKETIEREKTHLFHTFDTTRRFAVLLRRHLASWLLAHERGSGVSAPALSTAAGQGSKVIDEPTSGSGTGGKAPAAAK